MAPARANQPHHCNANTTNHHPNPKCRGDAGRTFKRPTFRANGRSRATAWLISNTRDALFTPTATGCLALLRLTNLAGIPPNATPSLVDAKGLTLTAMLNRIAGASGSARSSHTNQHKRPSLPRDAKRSQRQWQDRANHGGVRPGQPRATTTTDTDTQTHNKTDTQACRLHSMLIRTVIRWLA